MALPNNHHVKPPPKQPEGVNGRRGGVNVADLRAEVGHPEIDIFFKATDDDKREIVRKRLDEQCRKRKQGAATAKFDRLTQQFWEHVVELVGATYYPEKGDKGKWHFVYKKTPPRPERPQKERMPNCDPPKGGDPHKDPVVIGDDEKDTPQARYQAFGDYFAYNGGLDDYGYYDTFGDYYLYDGGYFDDYYYGDSDVGSGRYKREGVAAALLRYIYGDEYNAYDGIDDGYYGYDFGTNHKSSAKSYAYDNGARLSNYYGPRLKVKHGRNHRNRYGRRGLMNDMDNGEISGDLAGFVLAVMLFIAFIASFAVFYRYKMRKQGTDGKYLKTEMQITNEGNDADEDEDEIRVYF